VFDPVEFDPKDFPGLGPVVDPNLDPKFTGGFGAKLAELAEFGGLAGFRGPTGLPKLTAGIEFAELTGIAETGVVTEVEVVAEAGVIAEFAGTLELMSVEELKEVVEPAGAVVPAGLAGAGIKLEGGGVTCPGIVGGSVAPTEFGTPP
jgi:hypothetical protein